MVSPDLPAELAERLQPHLTRETGPGDGPFQSVSLAGVGLAAGFWGLSRREAMMRLLELELWPRRFARNRGVFTAAEQARLLAGHAAVIGCGGLGGHVATLLARVGLGRLTLCDYDSFDESNLNRQLLSREDLLGRNKAVAAGEEIGRIASHVEVTVHPAAAGPDNLPTILDGADLVVDCLDSIPVRRQVEEAAHRLGLPFIFGTVAGDEGLALVSRPGRPGLAAVYGPPRDSEKGAETALGVPTLTPAGLAVLEALLAVRELLGRNPPEPALWHLDLSIPLIETLLV